MIPRPPRNQIFLAALAIAVLAGTHLPLARADTLHHTDGTKIQGKITNETPDEVQIQTSYGTLTYDKGDLIRIEREGQSSSGRTATPAAMGPPYTQVVPAVPLDPFRPIQIPPLLPISFTAAGTTGTAGANSAVTPGAPAAGQPAGPAGAAPTAGTVASATSAGCLNPAQFAEAVSKLLPAGTSPLPAPQEMLGSGGDVYYVEFENSLRWEVHLDDSYKCVEGINFMITFNNAEAKALMELIAGASVKLLDPSLSQADYEKAMRELELIPHKERTGRKQDVVAGNLKFFRSDETPKVLVIYIFPKNATKYVESDRRRELLLAQH